MPSSGSALWCKHRWSIRFACRRHFHSLLAQCIALLFNGESLQTRAQPWLRTQYPHHLRHLVRNVRSNQQGNSSGVVYHETSSASSASFIESSTLRITVSITLAFAISPTSDDCWHSVCRGEEDDEDRSSPKNEARRTITGVFVPRGLFSNEAEKEQQLGFGTDSSDDELYAAIPKGPASSEVSGSEPTVGRLGVPVRNLPPSMMVGRSKDQNIRAEHPSPSVLHGLP